MKIQSQKETHYIFKKIRDLIQKIKKTKIVSIKQFFNKTCTKYLAKCGDEARRGHGPLKREKYH